MIPQSLTVWANKGGVGKTSLCLNLARVAGLSGWRVLLVDLDPQGNLADGLGYGGREDYDGGASLMAAVADPSALVVMEDIRPNIDCVAGGPLNLDLNDQLAVMHHLDPQRAPWVIQWMLEPIAANYDLILFDLPPSAGALHRATFTAVHSIVVSVTPDAFSRGGLGAGFQRYAEVKSSTNPDLEILAAVITRHQARYADQLERAKAALHDLLGDSVPVLDPPIRDSAGVDADMKEIGLTASEYVAAARASRRERARWMRRKSKDPVAAGAAPTALSGAGGGLAEDYDRIATQILELFAERTETIEVLDEIDLSERSAAEAGA